MVENDERWSSTANIFFDLWSPLLDHEKDLISRSIDVQNYNKNETIYKIGETPVNIMYILDGRVKISRDTDDGRPKIIRIFCDGQFFAYRAFFAGDDYTTDCVAIESSRIVTFPTNVIARLIDGNKNIMRFFYKELAKGLGMSDYRVASLAQEAPTRTFGRNTNIPVK